MEPKPIIVLHKDVKESFTIKEVKDTKLTYSVTYKKIQSTKKVIFILITRSSLLSGLHHFHLKITKEITKSFSRSRETVILTDEKLEVRNNAIYYYASKKSNSCDSSFKIDLRYIPAESSFKLLSTDLGFNCQAPDCNNHDVIILCQPEPNDSKLKDNKDNHLTIDMKKPVFAHKHILVSHSLFFIELFKDVCGNKNDTNKEPGSTPEYSLEFCSHKVLKFIVDFMHTGIPTISSVTGEDVRFWIEVLNYSVEWKVTKLQYFALLMCYSHISVDDAREILQLGLDINDAPDVMSLILDYVKKVWLRSHKKIKLSK